MSIGPVIWGIYCSSERETLLYPDYYKVAYHGNVKKILHVFVSFSMFKIITSLSSNIF